LICGMSMIGTCYDTTEDGFLFFEPRPGQRALARNGVHEQEF
jgi:hypothetical protein